MKINNLNDVLPQPPAGSPRPNGASKDPVVAAAPSASVKLSTLSAQVSDVESQLLGTEAVFDAQKVAEVKSRIEAGSYQVDPERIADRLIGQVAFALPAKA
jgi:negative regulator of flagellin synthesis FlgM